MTFSMICKGGYYPRAANTGARTVGSFLDGKLKAT